MARPYQQLDVFVVGTDHALYHKYFNGSTWSPSTTGYEDLGGYVIGNPNAAAAGTRVDVFVVGTNQSLFHKYYDGRQWQPI